MGSVQQKTLSEAPDGVNALSVGVKVKLHHQAEEVRSFGWGSPVHQRFTCRYGRSCQEIFENVVPEKNIKDSILTTNPVPLNIQGPKKLDVFFQRASGGKEVIWNSN